MSTIAVSTVLNARVAANEWLSEYLPDRFAAGIPQLDERLAAWRIPIWLAYPQLEPFGPVGEIVLDAVSGAVGQHTPFAEIRANAQQHYEQHREQIEAPFSAAALPPDVRKVSDLPLGASIYNGATPQTAGA